MRKGGGGRWDVHRNRASDGAISRAAWQRGAVETQFNGKFIKLLKYSAFSGGELCVRQGTCCDTGSNICSFENGIERFRSSAWGLAVGGNARGQIMGQSDVACNNSREWLVSATGTIRGGKGWVERG